MMFSLTTLYSETTTSSHISCVHQSTAKKPTEIPQEPTAVGLFFILPLDHYRFASGAGDVVVAAADDVVDAFVAYYVVGVA
jgi:hypothetical protein